MLKRCCRIPEISMQAGILRHPIVHARKHDKEMAEIASSDGIFLYRRAGSTIPPNWKLDTL